MLLDVEVAGEPGVVVPVAVLPVHVVFARHAGLGPDGPAIIVGLEGVDLAGRPVVDAVDEVAEAVVAAQAEPGDEREVFLLGLGGGGQHAADAGGVDGHRLLGEDVQPGLDGRFDVHGAVMRRRGQEHHVHAAGHELLIGVEADESPLGRDGRLSWRSARLFAEWPGCS